MSQAITLKIASELCSYHKDKKIPPLSVLARCIDSLRRIFGHRQPATVGDKALNDLVKLSKKRGGPAQLFQTDVVTALTNIAVAFGFEPLKTEPKKVGCEICGIDLTCSCSGHKPLMSLDGN